MQTREDSFKNSLHFFNESKDQFAPKIVDEQIKLFFEQKDLENTVGGSYVGKSLTETMFELILQGNSKRAAKFQKDFKVPDKRFYWIKIRALAQANDFSNLEKFSKEKKISNWISTFCRRLSSKQSKRSNQIHSKNCRTKH